MPVNINLPTEIETLSRLSCQTIRVQIGDVCCAISSRDARVLDNLRELCHDFLSPQPIDVSIELDEIEQLRPTELEAALRETRYIRQGNCFKQNRRPRAGAPDPAPGTPRSSGAGMDPEFQHLNRLLSQAFYAAGRVKHDGSFPAMLVRACGILRGGKVLVFTGPRESGKTTLARLCGERDGEVINDEMVLLSRPVSPGDGVSVTSAPIISRFSPRRNLTAPLCSIMFLKKSPKTQVRRLDGVEASLRFMRQIVRPSYILVREKRTILPWLAGFSNEVTKTVPVYELEFSLDAESLWRVVGETEGELERKEREQP